MRSIYIVNTKGPEHALEIRQEETPMPGPGLVRVVVKASGLNFAELMATQGVYRDLPPLPCVAGYEGAGVIDEVGSGVSKSLIGQRVMFLTVFKGHSTHLISRPELCFPIPDSMTFVDAAAMPVNFLTAYVMLFLQAHVKPGDKVLVHMAAGGVGTAALQLCKSVGDVETFGTASKAKHDAIKHICDHPIDYHTQDFVEEVRHKTDGRGVNIILDAVGPESFRKSYRLLAPLGHLVMFGSASFITGSTFSKLNAVVTLAKMWNAKVAPLNLISNNRTISGVNLLHLIPLESVLRDAMKKLIAMYEKGSIKPVVDSTFEYSEVAQGFRRLVTRQNIGKIVLVPDAAWSVSPSVADNVSVGAGSLSRSAGKRLSTVMKQAGSQPGSRRGSVSRAAGSQPGSRSASRRTSQSRAAGSQPGSRSASRRASPSKDAAAAAAAAAAKEPAKGDDAAKEPVKGDDAAKDHAKDDDVAKDHAKAAA